MLSQECLALGLRATVINAPHGDRHDPETDGASRRHRVACQLVAIGIGEVRGDLGRRRAPLAVIVDRHLDEERAVDERSAVVELTVGGLGHSRAHQADESHTDEGGTEGCSHGNSL